MDRRKSNNVGMHLILIVALVAVIVLAWRLNKSDSQIADYKKNQEQVMEENKSLRDEVAKLKQEKTVALLNRDKRHQEKINQVKEEIIAKDDVIKALKEKNKDFDTSNAKLIQEIDALKKEKKQIEAEDLKIKAEAQTLKDENGVLKYENEQLKEQIEKFQADGRR